MSDNRTLRAFKRSKTGILGGLMVLVFVLSALLSGVLSPYGPNEQIKADRMQGPSLSHPMGTTRLGEDVFSRILHGASTSLKVGILSVAISLIIGLLLGVLAGYCGGKIDMLIMRVIDVLMALPSILLAISIVSLLGRSLEHIMIAVGIVGIPVFARQVRASVLTVKELEFVIASQALGAGHLRILFGAILPNCMGPVIVLGTLRVATAILETAGLSFLGLGGEGGVPEWGKMLAENQPSFKLLPHTVLAPGLAISVTVLAFNLFGDALRDALDPRLHR